MAWCSPGGPRLIRDPAVGQHDTMSQSIREIMTADPRTVERGATVADAARAMSQDDVGAVLVVDEGRVAGILTDRDIVVRTIAEGRDPQSTVVTEICTSDPTTLTVDQHVEDAIRIVRDQNVRRIPVVQGGRPAGIVSIGDLAIERDPNSALADISSEPPNN
jgi:CBS domain-containing protein